MKFMEIKDAENKWRHFSVRLIVFLSVNCLLFLDLILSVRGEDRVSATGSKSLWLRAGGMRLVGNESEWSASDHRSLDAEPQQRTHHPGSALAGCHKCTFAHASDEGWLTSGHMACSVASSVHAYAAFWVRVHTVCSSIWTCELTGLPCRRSTEDGTEVTIIVNWSIN